ncbi:sugar transporter [Kordiimonas sediminis]|uniref:Sugar transporter n=1 Tax=Kordiimonas sediminis TaxID=1735581 RepID=A0A919AY09_9PROT|nr:MFS transporter [Kordiimonas sediminis]GHF31150.1 sugar transporter [Kordiimonas sediminis]
MQSVDKAVKLTYGMGQFAWAAKDVCFHYFLFFFYAQYTDLPPSMAGLAALLALIADGISDPLVGQISDNFKSGRWGRRHPFMIAATIPFAASLAAIFNPPAFLDATGLFIWFLSLAIIVRTFLTLFTVPHMALGAELSTDYHERTTIATYRNVLGYTGGLLIQVFAWFLLIPMAKTAGNEAAGYIFVGYFSALIAMVGMIIAIIGTRKKIQDLPITSPDQQSRPWYYAFKDILVVLKIPSGRILMLTVFIIVTQAGVANTMLIHINKYFYGFNDQQMGIFMLVVFLALLPSAALASRSSHRFGKRRATLTLILLEACILPILPLSHYYGLTPASGSGALLFLVCCYVVFHQTIFIGRIHLTQGMLPDVIDEGYLKTGRRLEGIFNSAQMLVQKITFGLGTFLAGLAIEYANIKDVSSIDQMTPVMTERLALVYGPGLAIFALTAALVFSRYPLTRKRHAEIREQLRIRETMAESAAE